MPTVCVGVCDWQLPRAVAQSEWEGTSKPIGEEGTDPGSPCHVEEASILHQICGHYLNTPSPPLLSYFASLPLSLSHQLSYPFPAHTTFAMSGQSPEVVEALNELRLGQSQLLSTLQALSNHVGFAPGSSASPAPQSGLGEAFKAVKSEEGAATSSDDAVIRSQFGEDSTSQPPTPASPSQKSALTSRIILTYVAGSSPRSADLYRAVF